MARSSRQTLRVGRAKFTAGDAVLAAQIWTAALEHAFAAQDLPALFVLSTNLGDAFAVQAQSIRAASASDSATQRLLQKSADFYAYALSVVDECALHEVLVDERHSAVQRSVRRIQAALARVRAAQEWRLAKEPPTLRDEQPCTTCGALGEELVRDESDGCSYCRACYDAYYASVETVDDDKDKDDDSTRLGDEETEVVATAKGCEWGVDSSSDGVSASAPGRVDIDSELVGDGPGEKRVNVDDTEEREATAVTRSSSVVAAERNTTAASEKRVYSIANLLLLREAHGVGGPTDCPEAILSSPVALSASGAICDSNSSKNKGGNAKSVSKSASKQLMSKR